jgi:hypothetical protein
MVDRADDHVGELAEPIMQPSKRDTFSSAWVACDHDETAIGQGQLDPTSEGIDLGHWQKSFERHIGPEGMKLQAIEGQ